MYGPLLLGEDRDEQTPRLGGWAGPRVHAQQGSRGACASSSRGVPYTLLRPPAIVGAGDTVISRGFVEALAGERASRWFPGRDPDRRVSVAFAEGVVERGRARPGPGPLGGAVHVVDAELSARRARRRSTRRALGRPCTFAAARWSEVAAAPGRPRLSVAGRKCPFWPALQPQRSCATSWATGRRSASKRPLQPAFLVCKGIVDSLF